MPVDLVLDARAELGEGPAWDVTTGHLTWVDIHAGDLHIFHPEDSQDECHPLGLAVGCATPRKGGGVIAGLRGCLAAYSPSDGRLTRLAEVEPDLPGNRCNDGKCDPAGRFVFGTMDNDEAATSGSLFAYSAGGGLVKLACGLRIPNGLAWSPGGEIFYHIDTPTRTILAYDYDLQSGTIANPRPVVHIPQELGWPDGMTCDCQGKLWVAMWAGAQVTRWDPQDGRLLEALPIPAWQVSACAFGGAGLDELYITTARIGLNPAQLAEYPLSGGLFRLRPGVQGQPAFPFAG